MPGRFPALAHREFRRYFTGQAIALVGGFAHNVAMAWLAYRLTGSVAVLGVVGFAQAAPTVLVAVALLRGLAFAFEIPIRNAFLADIVPDRTALPNAVALHSSALNGARFIGPAIGGLLIGAVGEAACFLLHPLTLTATLVQLVRIRTNESAVRRANPGSFLVQYAEGWKQAFSDPTVARMIAGVFLLGFGVGPYSHLMPAAVAELHGAHPEYVGMFLSSAGLGAMLAAMTLAARRSRDGLPAIAIAGNAIAAIGLAVFALAAWMPLAIAGMVTVGIGTIAQAVTTNMSIQLRAPEDKRGRVLAIYTAMFIGSTPIGSLFFGWVGQAIGAANALLAGAALAGAVAGCALPGVASTSPKTPFTVPDTTVPIVGSELVFPVRRIYCIGRNYAAHAREMGSDPTREPPFFFQKPTDAIQFVAPGTVADHPYPPLTKNYHYEVELVAALSSGGRNIPTARALDCVYAYALGLDMTRRDLQRAMGDEKKPWEIGKSFDRSAPIGPLHLATRTGHFTQGNIWLKVNGQTKQNADLKQMIWNVAEQISRLSEAFELFPGDIVYSGTPENVGPVVRGDTIECHIDGLPNLSVKIV